MTYTPISAIPGFPAFTADVRQVLLRAASGKPMRVFSMTGRSGGACKTTHTTHIGSTLAALGYKVLVIDLDGQMNASKILGYSFLEWTGPSILDVLYTLGGVTPRAGDTHLADVIQPALYREWRQDGEPLLPIPNMYIAPGSIQLSDADSILTAHIHAMHWFRLLVETELSEMDFDVVFLDLPASDGRMVRSTFVDGVEVIGNMAPEEKFYHGIFLTEYAIADTKKYAPSLKVELNAVIVGNYEFIHTGASQITGNREILGQAIDRWGPLVQWVVRKAKARMLEVYSQQSVMRLFAPEEPINDDLRVVAAQLGFAPREGADPDEVKALERALENARNEQARLRDEEAVKAAKEEAKAARAASRASSA